MKKAASLLMAMLLLLLAAGCGGNQEAQGVVSAETPSSTISNAPSTIENSSASESSKTEFKAETPEGIGGSDYTDVKVSLEKRGFPVEHPKDVEGMNANVYNSEWTDADTGIIMGCGMTINSRSEIVSASFSAENKQGVDKKTFQTAVDNYLEFCATMPYDKSSPDEMKTWVKQNLVKVNEKPKKQEGDAEFQLSGTSDAIILSVGKAATENPAGTGSSEETFEYINPPK